VQAPIRCRQRLFELLVIYRIAKNALEEVRRRERRVWAGLRRYREISNARRLREGTQARRRRISPGPSGLVIRLLAGCDRRSGQRKQAGQMVRWLETRSRWSGLRDLGQSHLVRASVLMPVFGYLLLLNEHVHDYLTVRYDGEWPFNQLPSIWRVWMLFYGSFLLAMGSLLFSWCCPVEIKRYASAFDLANIERPHLTAHNQTREIADRLRELYSRMSKWENLIFLRPRLKPDEPNLGAGTSSELTTADQWGLGLIHIWEVNDIKCPTLRITIFSLFRVGLFLLTVPAVFTFLQVSLLFGKHLFART
jgi:hypothetical protein